MNKKGEDMLIKEMIYILLAIMVLLILVTVAYKSFSILQTKTNAEQGKKSIEEITTRFESLRENEKADYLFIGPKSWYLYDMTMGGQVKECNTLHCLCLCDKAGCENVNVCKDTNSSTTFKQNGLTVLTFGKMEVPKKYILSKINNTQIFEVRNE